MAVSLSLFSGFSRLSTVPAGSLAKASSVGAKTVNGPPRYQIKLSEPFGSFTIALMTEAALYLGNDSGITHLAAACGTPTIALFGPTDLQIWAPLGPRVRIIRWKPGSSANNLPGESGKISESAPEVALVWDQVRDWLGL